MPIRTIFLGAVKPAMTAIFRYLEIDQIVLVSKFAGEAGGRQKGVVGSIDNQGRALHIGQKMEARTGMPNFKRF